MFAGRGRRNKREIGRRSDHLLRRREVSRVACVERRAIVRLPGQADARAELVGIDILIHLVEPQSGVQGQLVVDPPFVLKIGADQPAGLGAGIEYGERRTERIAGYGIDLIAGCGIDRQHGGYVVDQRALSADGKSKPQRVGIADAPGGIFLNAVDQALTVDVRRDAVEDQISDRIRHRSATGCSG